jgi:hypothetical protein
VALGAAGHDGVARERVGHGQRAPGGEHLVAARRAFAEAQVGAFVVADAAEVLSDLQEADAIRGEERPVGRLQGGAERFRG